MTRILKTTHKHQNLQPLQTTEIQQKLYKVKIANRKSTSRKQDREYIYNYGLKSKVYIYVLKNY